MGLASCPGRGQDNARLEQLALALAPVPLFRLKCAESRLTRPKPLFANRFFTTIHANNPPDEPY
jgi:hypothetical protein